MELNKKMEYKMFVMDDEYQIRLFNKMVNSSKELPDLIVCFHRDIRMIHIMKKQWWYDYYDKTENECYVMLTKYPYLRTKFFDVMNSNDGNRIEIVDVLIPINEFVVDEMEYMEDDMVSLGKYQLLTIGMIRLDDVDKKEQKNQLSILLDEMYDVENAIFLVSIPKARGECNDKFVDTSKGWLEHTVSRTGEEMVKVVSKIDNYWNVDNVVGLKGGRMIELKS